MGFTKLDDNIDGSSVFREDDAVFKVWILLLAKARKDGIAPVSADYVASICRKSDEETERCLAVLEAPDPRSRSTNDDGRRIRRVDGGYYIINYTKYRERADADGIREYERGRKNRQRGSGGSDSESQDSNPPAGANHLLGEAAESEACRLAKLIATAENRDATEVAQEANSYTYNGRLVRGKPRFDTLSDDALAHALRWLRERWAEIERTRQASKPTPKREVDPEAEAYFEAVSIRLAGVLDQHAHSTWIRPLRGAAWKGDALVIVAPGAQHAEWVTHNYAEPLAKALKDLGRAGTFEIVVWSEPVVLHNGSVR